MKYQIYGSNGFIGKHLKEATGGISIKRNSYKEISTFSPSHLLEGQQEIIVNLSTYGNYHFHTNAYEIWKANAEHVLKITERKAKGKQLINFSSSSVLLQKQTLYSLCKGVGEEIVRMNGGINIRPSSVTGVGEQPFHLIPTLIRSCLRGEAMKFVAHPTHDWIDCRDIVSATMLIAEKGEGDYNVSNNKSWTNKQVKEMVEDICRAKAKIEVADSLRSYDTEDWQIDNGRLKKLGWKAKYKLEDTIKDMVKAEMGK